MGLDNKILSIRGELAHAKLFSYSSCLENVALCSDSGRLTFLKETARSPKYLCITTGK